MNETNTTGYAFNSKLPTMSDDQFKLFSDFIYKSCGINLKLKKKLMLIARLYRRLNDLKLANFDAYYNYLLSSINREEEIINMIDAVTTNKTDFFREPDHFTYLNSKILPELIKSDSIRKGKIINIWSAGCSTGEEPYSIAIVLNEFFERNNLLKSFHITATDISTKVLDAAYNAIYKEDILSPVEQFLLNKYFTKINDKSKNEYKIIPELKRNITFKRLNLMDDDFKLPDMIDMIFCRNVVIYFDRKTQIELFAKFYALLNRGGYMFIGNSESLHGINDNFRMVAPTIYKKL